MAKKNDDGKTTGEKFKEGAKETVKETIREATGFPKMKKGANLWDWIKSAVIFLFAQDKGRSMMREALGEEVIKEAKVGIFGLGSADEKLYFKLKSLLNANQRFLLGEFEDYFVKSPKDFDRFRCFLAEIHRDYLEESDTNKANPKKSPALVFLEGIISRHGDEKAQMTFVGSSLAKNELRATIGFKGFFKNPLVIVPGVLVFGFAFFVVVNIILGFFSVIKG